MTELEQECIRRIAAAKHISMEALTLETTLESVQVDSLDRVALSFDLEDQYAIDIPESQLNQIRTVRDVAEAVQRALLKKEAALAASEGAA